MVASKYKSLSEIERVKIIDQLLLDGAKAIQTSSEAEGFVEEWMSLNNISDDSEMSRNIRIRSLPGLVDFALKYFQVLCERNNIVFSENGSFVASDYMDEKGEMYFPLYSKRTLEYDLRKLRLLLKENNIDDEVAHSYSKKGYYYKNEQGIGLSSIEKKDLNQIFSFVKELVVEARKSKVKKLDSIAANLQNYIGAVDYVDLDSVVLYEKEKNNNENYFNDLLSLILDRGTCSLIRVNNEKNKTDEIICPLFLRESNNRWYLLYINVSNMDSVNQYMANEDWESLFEFCMISPLDQIIGLEKSVFKRPKSYSLIGKQFFLNVLGAQRPRKESGIFLEKVLFKVDNESVNTAFLIKRMNREKLFPNLKLEKQESGYNYYSSEFFLSDDAINKVMSYQPKLIIAKGDSLKECIYLRLMDSLNVLKA
ncbi:hypothetical protein OAN33_05725 [Flavobacteriales bacterium]|nr:hypothetical protein [Flavobacteriales bacterium]